MRFNSKIDCKTRLIDWFQLHSTSNSKYIYWKKKLQLSTRPVVFVILIMCFCSIQQLVDDMNKITTNKLLNN